MHQAILVHADVDESAKGGDVGDNAFEQHAGHQIFDFLHAFGKAGGFELGAWVTTRFFKFFEDILNRRQSESIIGVLGRAQ